MFPPKPRVGTSALCLRSLRLLGGGGGGGASVAPALFLLSLRPGLPQGLLLRLLRLRIFRNQFRGGHAQCRVILEPRFHGFVLDGVGIELLVNPFGQAHLTNTLDVARPGAVRQAVQGMQDRFVSAQFRDRQALERGVRLLLFVLG